jgi:hypothetical protein
MEPAGLCRPRTMLQRLLCGSECECGYVLFGADEIVEHEVEKFFFADTADRFGIVEPTDNRQPWDAYRL